MRKRILAMCLVISMLMAMLCGCGKTETTAYSGKTDTKADKGMVVMGRSRVIWKYCKRVRKDPSKCEDQYH